MPAPAVVFTMRRLAHEWLKHVSDNEIDKVVGTVATGSYTTQVPRLQNPSGGYQSSNVTGGFLETGTVMGQITASKKYVPYTVGASDGSQVVAGILFNGVDVTSQDAEAVIIKSRSKVNPLALVWDASVNTTNLKNAALTALAAAGIVTTIVG